MMKTAMVVVASMTGFIQVNQNLITWGEACVMFGLRNGLSMRIYGKQ